MRKKNGFVNKNNRGLNFDVSSAFHKTDVARCIYSTSNTTGLSDFGICTI